MRKFVSATVSLVLLAACQGPPTGPAWRGQGAWRVGSYDGPMMHYGYCPGAPAAANGAQRGWHGPGMMMRGVDAGAWLDDAKTRIGVTTAQDSAWSAYAEAVEADRASMYGMHEQMRASVIDGASAADRLQAHINMMSARLASLQRVGDATRALYDVLAPEQRQRADQVLWSGCW